MRIEVRALGAAVLTLLLGRSLHGQFRITFAPPVSYAAGDFPYGVAVSDMNADSLIDIVAANQNSNNISLLLNAPSPNSGTFQPAVHYATGSGPTSVAIADFNADGLPDVATANFGSNNVSILLHSPVPNSGLLQTAVNYPAGINPISIAAADFNLDGIADLAVANHNGNNVSILYGRPAPNEGTFLSPVNIAVGAQPHCVVVDDFNVDGAPDFATADYLADTVSVVLNSPAPNAGMFAARVPYTLGAELNKKPISIAVGDYNGDALPDLAVAFFGFGWTRVLRNASPPSAGTFQVTADHMVSSSNMRGIAAYDFDDDSFLDVAVARQSTHGVVHMGMSCGFAGASISFPGPASFSIAIADVNGDGRPDIIRSAANNDTVVVSLNTSSAQAPADCDGNSTTACFRGIGRPIGGAIGQQVSGVAAGGSCIAGYYECQGSHPFKWSAATGIQDIDNLAGATRCWPEDMSSDGRFVVGMADFPNNISRPLRWSADGGVIDLGVMPQGAATGVACGVSDDGSVVVGMAGNTPRPFRWTSADGALELPTLPNASSGEAMDVSPDGHFVAGNSGGEACIWTGNGSVMGLGFLHETDASSYGHAISDDGSVACGMGTDEAGGLQAFRWTRNGGMRGLGHVVSGGVAFNEILMSADGSVIVGSEFSVDDLSYHPFYWAGGHMRDLELMLKNKYGLGPQISEWGSIRVSDEIYVSADGLTIMGTGGMGGFTQGWIAHIPAVPLPCRADLNTSNVVNVQDLLALIAVWGPCETPYYCPADLAPTQQGDHAVNVQDLLALIGAWGACP